MPGPLLRRPATAPYFYRLFLIFQISDTALTYLFFSKKILLYAKEFRCSYYLWPIVGGMGSRKMHRGEVSWFLKMDRELLGGDPSTFWCYHFSPEIECKVQVRSGRHSKLWLKQYSETTEFLFLHYFLAVMSGWVNELLHLTFKIFPFLDFMFTL